MFHFTFCNVLCVSVLCCIIQVAMTFSVCKNIHKEVDKEVDVYVLHRATTIVVHCSEV